ncbi:MAG: immunoglobulin domain-containing protein [Verrucomicrobiota bacterium]|nr:immunoglobulin domain-containing protein [Verrucomicrobiota bacterium]
MDTILKLRNAFEKSLALGGTMLLMATMHPAQAQSTGVGFHLVELPQGSSLVSNPYQSGSNAVADLFTDVPDGFSLSKLMDGSWQANTWSAATGTWSVPGMTLTPGEGALIETPEAYRWFTFGKPLVGQLDNWIPAGDSARGSRLAIGGLISETLGLDAPDGTTLFEVDSTGSFNSVALIAGGSWIPAEPSLEVGAALVINAPSGFNWQQDFQVEGIENPLAFDQQPGDQSLTEGDALTLSALASGADAISYQWQKNGNDIPGATEAILNIAQASLGDAGSYAVVASTTGSALRSTFANVSIEPAVVEPPSGPSSSVAVSEDATRIEISITGAAGQSYTIQATLDFVKWYNRKRNLVNETGTVVYSERLASGRSRFYRVLLQE